MVAFGVGGAFVSLQFLSYNGYLHIDYARLHQNIEKVMDLNGDGKFDENDASLMINKAYDIASYNMPSGCGFAAGFVMGLRF